MTWLKRALFALVLVLPFIGAAVWSAWPALIALSATVTLDPPALAENEWEDQERVSAVRRHIQRHFGQHAVYVPMEDIVLASRVDGEAGALSLFMQKACGRGKLYVWIPFRFRLPGVGEKVIEWCWKPRKTDA